SSDANDAKVVAAARARSFEMLKDQAARADASPAAMAMMAQEMFSEKNFPAAADYYRRALASDYANVPWRMGLAQALAESGEVPQALHEAKVCLRLRPQFAD